MRQRRPVHSAARGFGRGEHGVTMIEFALVFPMMLLFFIGLVEFGEAFSVDRKLSNIASTISDLVSQEGSVTTAELQDISTIANDLIQPYRAAPLALRIVSVVADAQNRTTVAWTYPVGALAVGSAYALPQSQLTEANSSIIVTQASYAFRPTIGYFIGSITLNGAAYFRPRLTRVVAKTD